MTRDEVLKEYAFDEFDGYWGESHTAYHAASMADEIVRLRDRLAAVEAELDALREQLTYQTIKLTAEHQRTRDILAALREPSRAVLDAANEADGGFLSYGDVTSKVIRAAVAAAERETSGA